MPRTLAVLAALAATMWGSPAAAQHTVPPAGPRQPAPWASLPAVPLPAAHPWDVPAGPQPGHDLLVQRATRRRAPGTVLMIVGGAVAGAGLLAEEDVLVVGGVLVAAYGLYLYLR